MIAGDMTSRGSVRMFLASALLFGGASRSAFGGEMFPMDAVKPSAVVEPELVSKAEFEVIGISARTTNQAEGDPKTAQIPGLWNRFYGEGILGKIPNKKTDSPVFGVYTNYESDYTGRYDLIASAEVASLDDVPAGMTAQTIPAGKYLVFRARGRMPDVVIRTWGDVWNYFSKNVQYKRAYTSDFELYKSPSEVDVYIAVK